MQVGDFFDGRYLILRILGQGGMGKVYLAQNMNTGTFWAIKEIIRGNGSEIDLPAEPKLLKNLDHPALPRLFDVLEQNGNLYMVFDYIEGIPLDRKLETEGCIPEETVIDWAIQLCGALDYLHNLKPHPVIYRDMKPSNIILTGSGALKLIDFGIAREYKPQSAGDTVYIGTRGYAAPEQYGTGQTTAASDIYSLGITLHQLITGKNPTEAPSDLRPVRFYNELLSQELEAIVVKCMAEQATERYQSVSELLQELCALKVGLNHKIHATAPDRIVENKSPANYGACFKKLVITVWDNAEFGCELAYMAAKHTRGEVVLADLDLLAPKADLFLNVKKYPSKLPQSGLYGHTGLEAVMNELEKGSLTVEFLRQAAIRRKNLNNLHVLTGNFRLENYEYYSEDSVPKLIEKCYRGFDITILLVNRSIYDAFTMASLLRSDLNITAIRSDIDKFREFNTYINFLKDKQMLPLNRTKFVLFEYEKALGMTLTEAEAATQGNLLGRIAFSRRRVLHRNLKGAYAARMEKQIEKEYIKLLESLGFLPARGILHGFRAFGGRLFRKTQSFGIRIGNAD